ncbi:MAG TPA: hypothetical protein VKZ83_03700 [Phototrophicaceae bacterium]|nr:hypothetical protein [Phototrophicaceae bacterium]
MSIRLCVLLWERPGRGRDLARFEDEVLALLPEHGGRLVSRHVVSDRESGDPLEVQLIEMPDEAALTAYMQDPARARLARAHDRDAVIARTQVLLVEPHRGPTGHGAVPSGGVLAGEADEDARSRSRTSREELGA